MQYGILFTKPNDANIYRLGRDGDYITVPTVGSAVLEAEFHYRAMHGDAKEYMILNLGSKKTELYGTPGDGWYTVSAADRAGRRGIQRERAWTNR